MHSKDWSPYTNVNRKHMQEQLRKLLKLIPQSKFITKSSDEILYGIYRDLSKNLMPQGVIILKNRQEKILRDFLVEMRAIEIVGSLQSTKCLAQIGENFLFILSGHDFGRNYAVDVVNRFSETLGVQGVQFLRVNKTQFETFMEERKSHYFGINFFNKKKDKVQNRLRDAESKLLYHLCNVKTNPSNVSMIISNSPCCFCMIALIQSNINFVIYFKRLYPQSKEYFESIPDPYDHDDKRITLVKID